MQEGPFIRLLALVRRELGAGDARVEIGGKDPDDDRLVWCPLPGGARLVAVFETAPEDADRLAQRLAALAEAFSGVAESAHESRRPLSPALTARRLDDELDALAQHAGAIRAVVIDDKSPVIWGSSEGRRGTEDVDLALATADALAAAQRVGVDLLVLLQADPTTLPELLAQHAVAQSQVNSLVRQVERIRERSGRSGTSAWHSQVLTARVVSEVRQAHELPADASTPAVYRDDFAYLVRPFAVIYRLILVYASRFSELHAEAAVIRALPTIERLVLALPPVEPPPREGTVIRMPLRRVK